MCHPDSHWVEHCLNGRPDDYRHLVRKYGPAVTALLTGRLGDAEQAEEIAQESFVRAWFSLRRLKKPEAFFAWLMGIAERVAKEHFRHRQRQRRLREALPPPDAPGPDGEGNALALKRAIDRLPAGYRDVVLLRYFGQMSCRQTAEQLGIPLGTATKRLSRAYAMLREQLSRERSES